MSNPYEQPAHQMTQPAWYGMPPQGHGAPPVEHHRPMRNGLGVAALVLGIIGAAFGLIPLLFVIAGILGVLAVIFGFVGRARAVRGDASNPGIALSGALLGLVSLGLATWGGYITVTAVDEATRQISQALSATDGAKATTPKKAAKTVAMGAVAHDGTFSMIVMTVNRSRVISRSTGNHAAQGSFVVVRVLVKNGGKSPAVFDGSDSRLLDTDSKEYAADSDATISQNVEIGSGLFDPINPGQKIIRVVVFDLPKTATPAAIRLSGVEDSGGALMALK